MISKNPPLAKVYLFMISLVIFSACMLVGNQKPTIEDTDAIENEASSPEAETLKNFEQWATIPYRDVQIEQVSNDGAFAALHIVVEFRESVALPWLTSEAVSECKKVGETWHCDETFEFQYTAAAATKVADMLLETQTSLAQEVQATQTLQAVEGCFNPALQPEEALIHQMQIDIWPEFDQPGVLVIYQAILSSFAPLPIDLTFRIPANAGEPNAVAQMSGSVLLNVEYTRNVRGEWAEITFTASSRVVHLEYYDPDLIEQGISHHFEYRWQGDYPLDDLIVQVRPPVEAENLAISPPMDGPFFGELEIYCRNFGTVIGQDIPAIMIDYDMDQTP